MVNDDGYSMVNDGYNLLGGIPIPLKNMRKSVGMNIPIYGKITNVLFQTTNQKMQKMYSYMK